MEFEEIYEGDGEVNAATETNNTLRSLLDDSRLDNDLEPGENLGLMLQSGMDDEAVVKFIFDSCDENRTGYVPASTLVKFLSQACGNNNLRYIFQQLQSILDPNGLNIDLTIEIFQEALKNWVATLNLEESKDTSRHSPSQIKQKAQLCRKSPSKITSSCEHLSGPIHLLTDNIDLQELHHKFSRVQEENKLLRTQMSDVEELIITLRTENTELKSVVTRVEQEASDITAKSQHLQEDNGALQNRLDELKGELNKISEAYNECQLELKAKTRELSVLEVNTSQEEHHCESLLQTVRHLEERLMLKEKELRAKDQEIQRITEELIEQQLSLDYALNNEDKPMLTLNTLASELHSSLGTPWKRQTTESALKPHSIPSVAWSAMLSEPEFEDAPKKVEVHETQVCRASKNYTEQEQLLITNSPKRAYGNAIDVSVNEVSSSPQFSKRRESVGELSIAYQGLAHSTPFNVKGFENKYETAACEKKGSVRGRMFTTSMLPKIFVKTIIAFLCFGLCAVIISSNIAFLLLSFVPCSSDWEGISRYHQQRSDLYPSSLGLRVIGLLKPYCRIEYTSSPPV